MVRAGRDVLLHLRHPDACSGTAKHLARFAARGGCRGCLAWVRRALHDAGLGLRRRSLGRTTRHRCRTCHGRRIPGGRLFRVGDRCALRAARPGRRGGRRRQCRERTSGTRLVRCRGAWFRDGRSADSPTVRRRDRRLDVAVTRAHRRPRRIGLAVGDVCVGRLGRLAVAGEPASSRVARVGVRRVAVPDTDIVEGACCEFGTGSASVRHLGVRSRLPRHTTTLAGSCGRPTGVRDASSGRVRASRRRDMVRSRRQQIATNASARRRERDHDGGDCRRRQQRLEVRRARIGCGRARHGERQRFGLHGCCGDRRSCLGRACARCTEHGAERGGCWPSV